jgi:hypothetical protein
MLTYVVKTKGDNSIIAFFLQGGYNRFDDYYYGRYRDIRYPDRVHVLHHCVIFKLDIFVNRKQNYCSSGALHVAPASY